MLNDAIKILEEALEYNVVAPSTRYENEHKNYKVQ